MSEWLCETCKHRRGKLRTYHRIDSQGVERSYTNVVKVNCTAHAKYPNLVKDAVKEVPYFEPWQMCMDFRGRGRRCREDVS